MAEGHTVAAMVGYTREFATGRLAVGVEVEERHVEEHTMGTW
jgi:hypothetical protein